jgi:hypothetical protein
MKTRLFAPAVGLLALIGSCTVVDQTGPVDLGGMPEVETVEPAVWATPLLRDKAVAEDEVEEFSVGPQGGSLEVMSAGLRITVPAGAVREPTTISVRVLAGDLVAYDFAPHGMTFEQPIEIQQSLRGTNWYKLERNVHLEAAYFADAQQLDLPGKRAQVNEFLPVTMQIRNASVRFGVMHFSGYLVSSGRRDPITDS